MEALKFVTEVRKHGIIKIPSLESYANKKVDVTITLKPEEKEDTAKKISMIFLKNGVVFFQKLILMMQNTII